LLAVGELTAQRFPWEPVPLEDTVALLQRDFAYAVGHTAVMVHSPHEALQIIVNTKRGQIVPRGECRFSDGSTLEFSDLGMPQIGVPEMNVPELMARVWEIARELGLELL
jgi:hypothetical protein